MASEHQIRVRVNGDHKRDWRKLKDTLGADEVHAVDKAGKEFLVGCGTPEALNAVRSKLAAAGVSESREQGPRQAGAGGPPRRGDRGGRGGGRDSASLTPETDKADLKRRPYGFVGLPEHLTTARPVWHDGTNSEGRLSGEVRFEIEALTPLLVGWERGIVGDDERGDWPIDCEAEGHALSMNLGGRWSRPVAANKSVLCPLRAPWGTRPVILPGDSLKGMLRHELGALLGAPMERVAERSYSYRPNASHPDVLGRFLEPRLARVKTKTTIRIGDRDWPVPDEVDILTFANRGDQTYLPRRVRGQNDQPTPRSERYNGGLGLPDAIVPPELRKLARTHVDLRNVRVDCAQQRPSSAVVDQYAATLSHLLDKQHGHFSARHPQIGTDQTKQRMGMQAVETKAADAFQPGDIVWVEWDTQQKCIVSLGWHYYYRWAYTDSVRRDADAPKLERHGLFPLPAEREHDADGTPVGLSAVRRLFGYTGDNEGSKDIGTDDHEQLMGRLFPNAAVEVVAIGDTGGSRFFEPTFLKELGMPRPSAVEHYVKQPYHPKSRPTDQAKLVTYGDAKGYDEGGELAGRKFYLDRSDAYTGEPWKDDSESNRLNDRSTLALEASRPGRRFRFTLRFRDLDPTELSAVLIALCPDQFKAVLGGLHPDGYCSKLGYARPLGWGSVRIEAKALLWLDAAAQAPTLAAEADMAGWVRDNHEKTASQDEWLEIHRRKHPDAADYPRGRDRDDNENIYTHHTTLRAEHSRARRYPKDGR